MSILIKQAGKSLLYKWLPYWAGLLVICITVALATALELHYRAQINHLTHFQAENIKDDLTSQLESRIAALHHMAQRWEVHKGTPYKEWIIDAAGVYHDYPGYQAILWVDNTLHTQWFLSEKNRPVPDLDQLNQEIYAKSAATHYRQVWLSPAIDIAPNTPGFLIYVPLWAKHEFAGFIVGMVKFQQLIDSTVDSNIAAGYSIAIAAANKNVYLHHEDATTLKNSWTDTVYLNLYGGSTWQITVWPTAAQLHEQKSLLPLITLIIGTTLAILLGGVIRLTLLASSHAQKAERVSKNLQKEITDRIAAEQDKKDLERALLQGQKLQAIGTMAGGIAHDFNNLLYAITGYTEMARDDVPKDAIVYQNLGKVLEASKRGQELIGRILTFSRRHHYEFKALDLNETVEGVLSLLKPAIPASVSIEYVKDAGSYPILGNQTQLHQVIVNIINNAVDAMDGEGAITLQLTRVAANDVLLKQFPHIAAKNCFKLAITDTGTGMDQSVVERIFEPFFTTKEVGKGTGLGLSTAHSIIQEHQGEIAVTSQLGKGTTFSLLLPEYSNAEP